jgi:hypothetical protein
MEKLNTSRANYKLIRKWLETFDDFKSHKTIEDAYH